MVEQQQQVRCLVDSGLTHEGGMSRVVGGPSGLPPPPPPCRPRGLCGKRAGDAAQTVFKAAGEPRLGDPQWWEKQANKEAPIMGRPSLSPGPAVAHGQQRREKGGEEGRAQCPARQATIPIHSTPLPAEGLDSPAETGALQPPTPRSPREIKSRGLRETVRQTVHQAKPGSPGLQHSAEDSSLPPRMRLLGPALAPVVPVHQLPDPPLLTAPGACVCPSVSPIAPHRTATSFGGAASG